MMDNGTTLESLLSKGIDALSSQPYVIQNLLKTLVLLAMLIFARMVVTKNVSTFKGLTAENRRKWTVNTRNMMFIMFFVGITFIWGYQIKEFAFSVAAVAIAFVMCFKEMITNFMGGVSRAISHPFSIGDRIIVAEFRGDVVDMSMLTTTILQIGPGQSSHQYTGSSISIPNSTFLNTSVINESFMPEYSLHVFHVSITRDSAWRVHEKYLLAASNIVCAPYLNKARRYMEQAALKLSFDPPLVEPRVIMLMDKADEIDMIVRIPVPSRKKGRIEQEIIRRYLEMLENSKETVVNKL